MTTHQKNKDTTILDESTLLDGGMVGTKATPLKTHCTSICMVPPPSDRITWDALTRARRELRDPGLFRWPHHANLLYPFLSIAFQPPEEHAADDNDANDQTTNSASPLPQYSLSDMVEAFHQAVESIEPFEVTLDTFGIFGGNKRGVLWLYPRSHHHQQQTNSSSSSPDNSSIRNQNQEEEEEPLIQLQSNLEKSFPMCSDQRLKGSSGKFSPHMTLSHFANATSAQQAQTQLETWWKPITFRVSEIYALQRLGDNGQFQRLFTIRLGATRSMRIMQHDPPLAFPFMPDTEEEWVRTERMQLKSRRRRRPRQRKSGGSQGSQDGEKAIDPRGHRSRSTDTPEVIALKRAQRKEKRERLQRERRLEEEERFDSNDTFDDLINKE